MFATPHLWLPSPPPNTSRHGIPRLLTTPSGDPHLAPVLGKQFIHAVAREVSVIIISETPPGSASLSMPIHCTQIVVVTDDGFCSRSWPEILVSRTFTLPSGMPYLLILMSDHYHGHQCGNNIILAGSDWGVRPYSSGRIESAKRFPSATANHELTRS